MENIGRHCGKSLGDTNKIRALIYIHIYICAVIKYTLLCVNGTRQKQMQEEAKSHERTHTQRCPTMQTLWKIARLWWRRWVFHQHNLTKYTHTLTLALKFLCCAAGHWLSGAVMPSSRCLSGCNMFARRAFVRAQWSRMCRIEWASHECVSDRTRVTRLHNTFMFVVVVSMISIVKRTIRHFKHTRNHSASTVVIAADELKRNMRSDAKRGTRNNSRSSQRSICSKNMGDSQCEQTLYVAATYSFVRNSTKLMRSIASVSIGATVLL